ncbi:MAG: hypothetical protein ACLR84_01850 [Clostridia bacterium]
MDTMEKIDFLKSMKSSCKDPEKIELIDAIIYDVEKPLAAFCKGEALYRYDMVSTNKDIETNGEVLTIADQERFVSKYVDIMLHNTEKWISSDFLHPLAEKMFNDMWEDLTAKQIEEIPKFQSNGLENYKQETEQVKENELDL